jgi:Leucine-rich repeat (LRR) protein
MFNIKRHRLSLGLAIAFAFGAAGLVLPVVPTASSQELPAVAPMSEQERRERVEGLIERGILQDAGKVLNQLEEVSLDERDLASLSSSDLGRLQEASLVYGVDADGLSYLAKAPSLTTLHFERVGASEDCLRAIGGMKQLRQLSLVFQPLAPKDSAPAISGLEHLSGLVHLETLDLRSPYLSDEGVAQLGTLRELRSLTIAGRLSDSALQPIAGLPNLEQLNFSGDKFTGAGLSHLARHPRLRELALWGRDFRGRGLAQLKDAEALRTLKLRAFAAITDEGAREVGSLIQLTSLDIRGAGPKRSTDETLASLGALRNLKSLTIGNCAMTDVGVADLERCALLEKLVIYGPDLRLTDSGLRAIGRLSKLRKFTISGGANELSDEGVKQLVRDLHSLESLFLDSDALSDETARSLIQIDRLRHVGIESTGLSDVGSESLDRHNTSRFLEER